MTKKQPNSKPRRRARDINAPVPVPQPSGPGRPRSIDWEAVRRFAREGATVKEITGALAIPPLLLEDDDVQERLESTVAAAHAQLAIEIRTQVRKRATRRGTGSPNTLAMQARNHLGWDRPTSVEPSRMPIEVVGAIERLAQLTARIQGNRRVDGESS